MKKILFVLGVVALLCAAGITIICSAEEAQVADIDMVAYVGKESKFVVPCDSIMNDHYPAILTADTDDSRWPPGAVFTQTYGQFVILWTPGEADEGKVYTAKITQYWHGETTTAEYNIAVPKLVKVVDSGGQACSPAVYGDKVVWQDKREGCNGYWGVYMYDLTMMTEMPIPGNDPFLRSEENPAIHGNIIVYETYPRQSGIPNLAIEMYNILDGSITPINQGHYYVANLTPDIYDCGDGNAKVVWQRHAPYEGDYHDIYRYEYSSEETAKIYGYGPCHESSHYPVVYGNIVAFAEKVSWDKDAWRIIIYDVSTGKYLGISSLEDYKKSNHPLRAFLGETAAPLDIYENKIVWAEKNTDPYPYSGYYQLSVYDIATGAKRRICGGGGDSRETNPAIYKDIVVWQDNRNGNWDIYMCDMRSLAFEKEIRLTDSPLDETEPAICGNKIVWVEGGAKVYAAVLPVQDTTPPATPIVTPKGEGVTRNPDGTYSTTKTTELGAMIESSDPESNVYSLYRAIGTSPGADDILEWSMIGAPPPLSSAEFKVYKTLVPGKTYYISAKAKNGAGLVSDTGSIGVTVIISDTTPPANCSIKIRGGAEYINYTSVTLDLYAEDAESGVAEMRFSNDNKTYFSALPYAVSLSKPYPLPAGNGTKTIYVQFKDKAGNWSTAVSASVMVDTTLPTGTIKINNDVPYTKACNVVLTLSAADTGSGVSKMKLSNTVITDWSKIIPEPYAKTKNWTISSGDGTKAIYVKFIDAAGNESSPGSDSIILDTAPPTIIHTPITSAPKNKSITFNAVVTDAASGVSTAALYWRKWIWNWGWRWSDKYSLSMTSQGSGRYSAILTVSQTENRNIKYYITAVDKAGNARSTSECVISRY